MRFRAEIHQADTSLHIALQGELRADDARQFKTEIDELLVASPTTKHLVFDCSQLEFISSAGIGAVMNAYRLIRDRGGSVEIHSPQDHIREIFVMSRLDSLIRLS